LDMTAMLSKLIHNNVKIMTVPIEHDWFEVDSEQDLILYEQR